MRGKGLIFLLLIAANMKGQMALDLEKGFRHPPDAAKPWVFWYWMQGAVSKEGIRADLQAMKEQGIGGAYLMPINDVAKPPLYTPVVRQLSPAWWQMVRYAMKEADSLGLQLAMHACDGFAVAGGPWITPELSMQKVVWSRSVIEGGRQIETVLPQPETHEKYYKDLAILAFPTPANWEGSTRTTIPQVTTSSGATAQYLVQEGNKESFKSEDACWIQYTFDHPFTCRTIIIHSTNNYQSQRLLVQVSDDGINFRPAGRLTPPRHGWEDGDAPVTHTIPAVTARYFRLVYDKTGSEPGAEDLDAAKWKPSLKVSGIELSAMPSIGGIEGKSGVVWRISERSTAAQLPDSSCVDPHTMIDLTHRTDAQGRLTWKAPAGHWTLLRIGHTSTGHTNETGGGGKGLECDKFNPRAVNLQFDRWFGETIRQAGPELASRVLKIFHVDSWECGSQNWSPVFREEFKRRRGYDPLRWLPVMAGIPLASADSSENFLKDIRQTITELIHDNFFAVLAQRAHAKGCSFSAESVAPTMTSDGMLHYSEADIPMGEFWLRSPTHDKPNDILDAISGAHIYGKTLVQAEAFTELREAWDEYPGLLKTLQDRNYALGINRLVFHVFTHNPWTDRKPGMTLGGVGTFLQRDQTWWAQSSAWITYTQRCQWLLQQGSAVADIAVFTGEEIPRRALLPERLVTTLPGLFGKARVASEQLRLQNTGEPTTKFPNGVVHAANMSDPAAWIDPLHGYAYDCLNPDVLLHRTSVDKGHIVLPEGARYSILVIPCSIQDRMSPEVTARLQQLVQAGATILIKGEDPAGQSDQPLLDQSFREVKDKNGYSFLEARVGEGKVIRAPFRASSLEGIGIEKDFSAMESDYRWNAGAAKDDTASEIVVPALHPATGIAYTHRTAPGFDIYFVSNQQDRQRIVNLSLRISGRKPEIWDAVTGEITPAGQWSQHGGHTVLPVHLDANGSLFLVFRQPSFTAGGVETNDEGDNYTEPAPVQTLHAPWTLHFDTAAGGPAAGLVLDSLEDWSRNADSAIRYYSGTAAYQQSFQWDQPTKDQPMKDQPARDQPADGRLWLDLGRVNNIARVTLNGVDCGIAWTPPYRVEITRAIKKGNNTLKIEVTNTWANRLTGDHLLPENKRATWTTSPYHLDGKLLPAGLLGPVLIVR